MLTQVPDIDSPLVDRIDPVTYVVDPDIGNKDIRGLASYRVAKLGVGLVPEGRQIFPNLTVRENLEFYASVYNVPRGVRRGTGGGGGDRRSRRRGCWSCCRRRCCWAGR